MVFQLPIFIMCYFEFEIFNFSIREIIISLFSNLAINIKKSEFGVHLYPILRVTPSNGCKSTES